jgi:hypothetical protein
MGEDFSLSRVVELTKDGNRHAARAVLYLCLVGDPNNPIRYKKETIDDVIDTIAEHAKARKKVPLDSNTRFGTYYCTASDMITIPANSTTIGAGCSETFKNMLKVNLHDVKLSEEISMKANKERDPVVLEELE